MTFNFFYCSFYLFNLHTLALYSIMDLAFSILAELIVDDNPNNHISATEVPSTVTLRCRSPASTSLAKMFLVDAPKLANLTTCHSLEDVLVIR